MTNQIEKIEPHAARLEAAADRMAAEGIGGDTITGHVAVMRALAADLRASATLGRIPTAAKNISAVATTVKAAAANELPTPLQAMAARSFDPTFPTRVNRLKEMARRLGHTSFDLNKPIDVALFDRETRAGGNVLTESESRERMAWKCEASRLGLCQ
jgi:hypothetical protein